MDVLSDVLGTVRLHGMVWGSLDLAPPWGLAAAARPAFIFHIVARGQCWFEVEGAPPIHVSTGDVLVLAPNRAHVLRDSLDSVARPFEEVMRTLQPTKDPGAMQ